MGKDLGPTLNVTPEVVTKNLGIVQNSTPKHVACPEYAGDTKIQFFVFDHWKISKRRTFGNLRVFEIHVFVFDLRWLIKVGVKIRDI